MFEEDLFAYWQAHPQLGAGSPAIRLVPGRLPANPTFPIASYQRISAPGEQTQEKATDFVDARYQFSVYDDDWLGAWQAAKRVKNVFKRWTGTMGSSEVQSSRIDNDNDSRDPESGLPRRLVDVIIRHKET